MGEEVEGTTKIAHMQIKITVTTLQFVKKCTSAKDFAEMFGPVKKM